MKYTHVAILIHWLTAIAIIGLLAAGKFMADLDETNPLRFSLTQSHKTFGILVLGLSVLRLVWRLTHKAPPHPVHAPEWEKLAASASHLFFYALIFIMPLSGWAMVSVSPLNIDTLLFNKINVPHLPLVEWLGLADAAAQQIWEHRLHKVHESASTVLIVLLLVHMGAALKHHFIDKDDVLNRMTPRWREQGFLALVAALVLVVGASVFALNRGSASAAGPMVAQSSQVSLRAMVSGDDVEIKFGSVNITANLDLDDLDNSRLKSTVDTSTATSSDNLQVEGSLPDADWFDVANYPQATFVADSFTAGQGLNTLDVTGQLTVKNSTVPISFVLSIEPATDTQASKASTQFEVDRFDLELGLDSQADETWVGRSVIVFVEFELSTGG